MPKGVYDAKKRRKPVPVEERFWLYVDKKDNEDCWNWTGIKKDTGYGFIRVTDSNRKSKMMKAHRISWILKYGEIQKGLHVLHKCDNPSCVNPGHLFLGTHSDNMQDMAKKGRANSRRNKSGSL